MQAITTKFFSPTNSRGSRIKAICDAGTVVIPWDYALGVIENHDAACAALVKRMGWDSYRGRWVKGSLPESNPAAYCYVYVSELATH